MANMARYLSHLNKKFISTKQHHRLITHTASFFQFLVLSRKSFVHAGFSWNRRRPGYRYDLRMFLPLRIAFHCSGSFPAPNFAARCNLSPEAPAFALLSRLLQYHPDARISAAEALKHPYFSQAPLPSDSVFTDAAGMPLRDARFPSFHAGLSGTASAREAKRAKLQQD
jgi:serine/threonine protein kinase